MSEGSGVGAGGDKGEGVKQGRLVVAERYTDGEYSTGNIANNTMETVYGAK